MSAAQTQNNAGPSDVMATLPSKATVLANLQQSSAAFLKANNDLVQAIKKFVSGNVKDFKGVVSAVAVWSDAKLKHREAIFNMVGPIQQDDEDEEAAKIFFYNSRAVYEAQLLFEKARSLLDSCPMIDKVERDAVNKVIKDTEEEFKDAKMNFDILSVCNVICF